MEHNGALLPVFDRLHPPRLRVEGPPGAWALTRSSPTGPVALPTTEQEVAGGATLVWTSTSAAVPPGDLKLNLHRRGSSSPVLSWDIRWIEPLSEDPRLAPLEALRQRGDLAGLQAATEALSAAPALVRIHACREVARGHAMRSDSASAAAASLQCARLARDLGAPHESVRSEAAAVYYDLQARRYTRARATITGALDQARKLGFVELEMELLAFQGWLLSELGDARNAERVLLQTVSGAQRYGLHFSAANASFGLANLLAAQGRHQAAIDLMREASAYVIEHPEARALLPHARVNLGWVLAQAMVHRAIPTDFTEPTALFTTASDELEVLDPIARASAVANLAWLQFLQGDLPGCRATLGTLRADHGGSAQLAERFVELLEAELTLADGHLEAARAAFRAVERHAREDGDEQVNEYVLRAQHGAARALLAMRRPEAALEAYRAALSTLARTASKSELRVNRALFFSDRRAVVEEAVALLLTRGHYLEALRTMDDVQARVIGAMANEVRVSRLPPPQRAIWDQLVASYQGQKERFEAGRAKGDFMSADVLERWQAERKAEQADLGRAFDALYAFLDQAAPAEQWAEVHSWTPQDILQTGQALLSFFPTRERTYALLAYGDQLESVPVDAHLPDLLWEKLRTATHLYVVSGGWSEARDLAIRTLGDGSYLLEKLSISQIPRATWHALVSSARPIERTLVVSNPDGDLPFAAQEGALVTSMLPNSAHLLGAEASRRRTLGELAHSGGLHFAGHGATRSSDPWQAHLSLAGHDLLSLEDVLFAQTRLGTVVLSGCETGRALSLSAVESVGLPEAFLTAGAHAVLASEHVLDDAAALEFIRQFYAAGGANHPVEAFRVAATVMIRRRDDAWRAFRVFGRDPSLTATR